jgi:hypothetical protein
VLRHDLRAVALSTLDELAEALLCCL